MRHLLLVGWITFVLLLGSCLLVYGQTTAILSGNVTDAMTANPCPLVTFTSMDQLKVQSLTKREII